MKTLLILIGHHVSYLTANEEELQRFEQEQDFTLKELLHGKFSNEPRKFLDALEALTKHTTSIQAKDMANTMFHQVFELHTEL